MEWKQSLPALALGLSSIITQTVLLREFLSVFYGNELVIAIILSQWMLLTGIGAYLGKLSLKISQPRHLITVLLFLLSIIPPLIIISIRYFRNIIFSPGSMIELNEIILSSLILQLPFCLTSGFVFTTVAYTVCERYSKNLIGKVYAVEAVGSILGGVLFVFVLQHILNCLQILFLTGFIVFGIAIIWIERLKLLFRVLALCCWAAIVISVSLGDLDSRSKSLLYPEQKLIFSGETPYGTVTATKQAEQTNFYDNNVIISSSENVISRE